jgi:preprotein translocase subunit SecB
MLQIKPSKFKAVSLNIARLPDGEPNLEANKLDLSVEAVKAGDKAVSVLLNLRLALEEHVQMSLCYGVTFDVEDPENADFKVVDSTLTNTFIQVNAAAIAYPFLRAYVSTVSINSGYKSILLPAVNFQAIFNDKKAKAVEASSKILT